MYIGYMKYEIFESENLEKHGLFTKFVRIFSVPLLNLLPGPVIQRLMRRSSRDAEAVLQNRGSSLALEVMYVRYQRGLFQRGILQGIADLFWHHVVSQPKALRNRLKITESFIKGELASRLIAGEKVTLVSLGGGSARGVMQSLKKISEEKSIDNVRIVNIDRDLKALDSSRELAKRFGIYRLFEWKNDDARDLDSLVQAESADIIEMVGLLDYFSEDSGIALMKKIYNTLKRGGVFIFANIHPNPEMVFVNKTGWPKMYYRTPRNIEDMLKAAGFGGLPKIIFEPLKVHIVVSVKK